MPQSVSLTSSGHLKFTTSDGESASCYADSLERCLRCGMTCLSETDDAECADHGDNATPCGPFAIYEYRQAEDHNGNVLHVVTDAK